MEQGEEEGEAKDSLVRDTVHPAEWGNMGVVGGFAHGGLLTSG